MSQPFSLTPSQSRALQEIIAFVESGDPCLLLTGGAGTGKTTLLRAAVEALQRRRARVELLAPTGRAARVLARKAGHPARTIHAAIYNFNPLEVREEVADERDPCLRYIFPLKADEPARGVWIVDEASMVGDEMSHSDTLRFGSGRLLSDLLSALRLGARRGAEASGAQVIFVGDPAQLPPVSAGGGEEGGALDAAYLASAHRLPARQVTLREVVRQAAGSGPLAVATRVREALEARELFGTAIRFGEDVAAVSMGEVVEALADGHARDLSRALITQSNAEAYRAVRAVRERLFGTPDEPLRAGERLLVMRNHHGYQLSNGDLVRVNGVWGAPELVTVPIRGRAPVELSFVRLSVTELDAPGGEAREALILYSSLWLDSRDEPPELTQALLADAQRRSQLRRGSEAFSEFLVRDERFNALRVRFGYALTCHKAQGGEWDEVFLTHEAAMPKSALGARWLYTAVTRARRRLGVMGAAAPAPAPSAPPDGRAEVVRVSDLAALSGEARAEALARGAFARAGVSVEEVARLQHRLRFSLRRGEERAQVDVQYRGTGELSQLGGAPEGWGLTLEGLRALRLAERERAPAAPPAVAPGVLEGLHEPAYRERVSRAAAALAPAGIAVTRALPMSYALRLHLSGPEGEGALQFTHRADFIWSGCVALNAAPTSQRAVVLCRG